MMREREKGSSDALFTTLIALATVAITMVFIAAGSGVASLTFTPHGEHAGETH